MSQIRSYKMIQYEILNEVIKKTTEDGIISFIPKDEANADYETYLKSLEENTIS